MSSGEGADGRRSVQPSGRLPVVLSERELATRGRRRDRWWLAGLGAWCGAVVWCWGVTVGRARTVARVDDTWVMWWHLAPVLALLGAVCLGVAAALSLRTGALRRAELRVLPRARRRTGRTVATMAGAAVLAVTLAVVAALQGETVVTVLGPSGPDGCTVVVEESRALMSGSGRIGVLGTGGLVPDWQGTYGSDDGYRPFTDGGYELTWRGAEADVVLVDPSQPTGPQAWRVSC